MLCIRAAAGSCNTFDSAELMMYYLLHKELMHYVQSCPSCVHVSVCVLILNVHVLVHYQSSACYNGLLFAFAFVCRVRELN